MKDLLKFENPFRPVFEYASATAWGLGALGMAGTSLLMPYPPTMMLGFAGFAGLMAGYRALPGLKLSKMQKAMGKGDLTFMTREELLKVCKQQPGHLFLGYGFNWGQAEAQLSDVITRHDPVNLLPQNTRQKGQAWLHGVGATKEEPIFIPVDHTSTHTLILGTTGSGKTRMFDNLIAQTVQMGHCTIIIDPKGDKDMCEAARLGAEAAGRKFAYFHPARPEISVRIDPLKNFNRATELATRIANLIPSETGSDPFTAFSQMALNKACEALLFIDEKPSLVLLRRLFEAGMTELMIKVLSTHFEKSRPARDANGMERADGWYTAFKPYEAKAQAKGRDGYATAMVSFYRDHIQNDFPNSTVEGLVSSFEHDSTHFSKMVTSLMPILNMLTSGALGPLLSPDYEDPNDTRPILDFGKITKSDMVIFLGLDSLSDSMVASAIGSLFLSDLTAVAGDRYNFGTKSEFIQISLFIDEVNEVMNQPLIQLLNKGRGSAFSIYMATQTMSDIVTRLGSKDLAMKTFGNVNNMIVLRCNDTATQEFVSESFPETVIRKVDVTFSSKNEVNDPLTFSGTMAEKLSEEKVPLVNPKYLSLVPDLQGFAKVSAGRVVKWRVPILQATGGKRAA